MRIALHEADYLGEGGTAGTALQAIPANDFAQKRILDVFVGGDRQRPARLHHRCEGSPLWTVVEHQALRGLAHRQIDDTAVGRGEPGQARPPPRRFDCLGRNRTGRRRDAGRIDFLRERW